MLSINDVCWHGIIWAAWVLTMNKLVGNDETGALLHLSRLELVNSLLHPSSLQWDKK